MKLNELIAQIRKHQPGALKNVADPAAVRLLRAGLAAIRKSLEACDEGRIHVAGLGNFIVRKAVKGAGDKAMRVVRFVVAKPAAGGGKATAGAPAK